MTDPRQFTALEPPIRPILADIERQWEDVAAKSIRGVIAEQPNERFYAAGFWLFYLDYTVIAAPALGINRESDLLRSSNRVDAEALRWDAANWKLSVLMTAINAMTPAYEHLSDELAGQDDTVWKQVEEAHKMAIARVCRRLTDRARSGEPPFHELAIHADFVVGIFDARDGLEEYRRLIRASVAPELIEQLRIPMYENR